MRQNALRGDILRRADENTRQILTALIAATGMEAEVVFDDGTRNILRPEAIKTIRPIQDLQPIQHTQPALPEPVMEKESCEEIKE